MGSEVDDYKVALANTEYFLRSVLTKNKDNIKDYWNTKNNITIHEPFEEMWSEEVTKETGDGSITPATHIYETTAYLNEDKSTFVTEYAYPNKTGDGLQSHVVRFGIKSKSAVIIEEMKEIINESQNKSVVSSNFTEINKVIQKKELIKFTDQEKNVLNNAIKYLKNNESKKSVIVDIFERQFQAENPKSTIKSVTINESETHSVVILRSDTMNKYFVVDPNKTSFSCSLGVKDLIADVELIVPSKQCEIYKAGNKTKIGQGKDQWRDCIDIAVKLAFLFNNMENLPTIEELEKFSVSDWKEVQLVSNQTKIDANILDKSVHSQEGVRIKQISDILDIKEYSKVRDKFQKLREDYNPNIQKKIADEFYKKSSEIYNNSESIKNLHTSFNQIIDKMVNNLNSKKIDCMEVEEIGNTGGYDE